MDSRWENFIDFWLDFFLIFFCLDLLLFNSADDSFDPKSDVNAVIYSSGEVSYLPPGMFKSTCQIESNLYLNLAIKFDLILNIIMFY